LGLCPHQVRCARAAIPRRHPGLVPGSRFSVSGLRRCGPQRRRLWL